MTDNEATPEVAGTSSLKKKSRRGKRGSGHGKISKDLSPFYVSTNNIFDELQNSCSTQSLGKGNKSVKKKTVNNSIKSWKDEELESSSDDNPFCQLYKGKVLNAKKKLVGMKTHKTPKYHPRPKSFGGSHRRVVNSSSVQKKSKSGDDQSQCEGEFRVTNHGSVRKSLRVWTNSERIHSSKNTREVESKSKSKVECKYLPSTSDTLNLEEDSSVLEIVEISEISNEASVNCVTKKQKMQKVSGRKFESTMNSPLEKSTKGSSKKKSKDRNSKHKMDPFFLLYTDQFFELESDATNNESPKKVRKKSMKEKGASNFQKRARNKTKNVGLQRFDSLNSLEEEIEESSTPKKKDRKKKKPNTSSGKILESTGKKENCPKDKSTRLEKKSSKKEKNPFPEYIPVSEMQKILENQENDEIKYVEGNLRINPRMPSQAYLEMPKVEKDLLIVGSTNRNRAMEGDSVVAEINPESDWQKLPSGEVQKTGTVVCILKKVHSRKAVGLLKLQGKTAIFQPRDHRVPRMMLFPECVPENFQQQPELYKDTLFLGKIVNWNYPKLPIGRIEETIGNLGDLAVETAAILLENGLDVTPYDDDLINDLPPADYVPTSDDLRDREDWREKCIFTIDPATAVDLDDAMSCELLDNGNYEVGVHISDVTRYLEAFSPLDDKVAKRATTVYLVNTVYHMLPKQLCQVCSLLPGQDKLAFSVIWEMTPEAEIVKHRFAKVVMRSCYQMAYEQAQDMIENPSKDWSDVIKVEGDFSAAKLCENVNHLFRLSRKLRDRRFTGGALRIDQPKLCVALDKSTGLPISSSLEERKDSNSLIEEFMLLANITVATHLHTNVPEYSLLRTHREPLERMLKQTRDALEKLGVHMDIESAGDLQASISRYEPDSTLESEESSSLTKYRMMVINTLCAKAMTRALYKCSSSVKNVEDLRHYALNVPLYTHFTSPIRRYADCVVHRLLDSSINNIPPPKQWTAALCSKIAANCNLKKYSAKLAQEQSNELYFTQLIDMTAPASVVGIVMDVRERNCDAILCKFGIVIRLYFADIESDTENVEFSSDYSVPTVTIKWKNFEAEQVITMFSIIHLRISKHPDLFRLRGVLLPPVT